VNHGKYPPRTMNNLDGLELPPRADRTSLGSDSPPEEAGADNSANNKAAREVKKRNRIPVSCNECRRRKLRSTSFVAPINFIDVIEKTLVRPVFNEAMLTDVNSLNLCPLSSNPPPPFEA
jgi:hypothetical protein